MSLIPEDVVSKARAVCGLMRLPSSDFNVLAICNAIIDEREAALSTRASSSRAETGEPHWLVTFEDGRTVKARANPGLGLSGDGFIIDVKYVPAAPASSQTELAEVRRLALEEAARVAYRVCAETRHVTLGDSAAAAIRALASMKEG
jgi:hypothetical protein